MPGYPHSHQRFSSLCSKYLVNALREIINSFVSMCKYNNFCPNRLFLWVKNNFSLDLLTAFPCLCIMLGRVVGLFLRLWISALLSTPRCEYLAREMFCPRFFYLSLPVLTVLLRNGYSASLLVEVITPKKVCQSNVLHNFFEYLCMNITNVSFKRQLSVVRVSL